jgi:hypothetical protein
MSLFGTVAIILATLGGPVFAVQVQKYLERRRASHERRLAIFRALMSTRAARLSGPHVEALNMIDVEFYEARRRFFPENKPFRRVRSAWNAYLDHLRAPMPTDKSQEPVFFAKREDLFTDLLYEMALALGYEDFDKTYIKNQSYMPQWHGDIELEQTIIRKGLAEILAGKKDFPMRVTSFPFAVEPAPTPPSASSPSQGTPDTGSGLLLGQTKTEIAPVGSSQ